MSQVTHVTYCMFQKTKAVSNSMGKGHSSVTYYTVKIWHSYEKCTLLIKLK